MREGYGCTDQESPDVQKVTSWQQPDSPQYYCRSLCGQQLSGLKLRVVIPHFFREEESDIGTVSGYGSCRTGNRFARCMSLARCISGVLALSRAPTDWILNHAESHLEKTPISSMVGLNSIEVEVHLFVCGEDWLKEVVDTFSQRIHIHRLDLANPRQLPMAAVRHLLDMPNSCDFSMYLEDDLVICDSWYLDKVAWFYNQLGNAFALMPHRRELTIANAPIHLYIDGPIKPDYQVESVWASNEHVKAQIKYWDGSIISFADASNPHSGSFCISKNQLDSLRSSNWPPIEFVGPLETACTGIMMQNFQILKPTWPFRYFLALDHANPSFLNTINSMPKRGEQS